MATCTTCGTNNVPAAKFCENCGSRLSFAPPPAPATPPAFPAASVTPRPKPGATPTRYATAPVTPRKSSRRKVLAAVGIVGVGVFGVVPRAVNGWDSEASQGLSELCALFDGGTVQCLCYTQLVKLRMSPEDLGAAFAGARGYEWVEEATSSIAGFCGVD